MKRFVFAAVAAASMLSAVAPASAQYWERRGDYRWGGRDRVIVQEAPGVSNQTLITLFALQALQAAQQQKEDTVVVERKSTREYVPLK